MRIIVGHGSEGEDIYYNIIQNVSINFSFGNIFFSEKF